MWAVAAESVLAAFELARLRAEIVEHVHANGRRQVAAIAVAIDFSNERGQGGVFPDGDFTQAMPEFVFQRNTGLVSIEDD